MKALVCLISWNAFYRSEEAIYPCEYILESRDAINFVNFDGQYYGFFNNKDLNEDKQVDYLIFVAKHPILGVRICGWYKDAIIYKEVQYHEGNIPYVAKAKDEGVVLLEEKDRDYGIQIDEPFMMIDIDRRLKIYLEKSNKRINYIQTDLNKTFNLPLNSLKESCEMIEKAIMNNQYLLALQITNRGLLTYGRMASLIYYKAWILYLFRQYKVATVFLSQILNVEAYQDLVCYMLGNIFFETGEYEKSIKMLNRVRNMNQDMTFYMLSQAYAMLGDVAHAKGAIERALMHNPNEEAYLDFKQSLKEWEHAK